MSRFNVKYDNDFRIKKAAGWRQGALDRKAHANDQIDSHWKGKPGPWWCAMHNIADSCADRIQLIDALFPEIRQ